MGDISNKAMGRKAQDEVGAWAPMNGENRVQAAMRHYLGACASRARDRKPPVTTDAPSDPSGPQGVG